METSWYGENCGIDLSDRTADAPVGSVIEWHTWCGPTRATVVSYGQGIYGAAGVSLRSSDGHVESHPSGLPRDWRLVTAPRAQWFDPSSTCTNCDHAACRDCAADGAHHCSCEYDETGRRVA